MHRTPLRRWVRALLYCGHVKPRRRLVPALLLLTAGCGGKASGAGGSGTRSCAPGGPGLTDCGTNPESCCTTLDVPGGTFYRTYTYDADDAGAVVGGVGGEAAPATVSAFRLDQYLVTVGRFRQFVAAWKNGSGGYVPPPGAGKHSHLNAGQGLVDVGAVGVGYETGWQGFDNGNVQPTIANLACDQPPFATWTESPGPNERLCQRPSGIDPSRPRRIDPPRRSGAGRAHAVSAVFSSLGSPRLPAAGARSPGPRVTRTSAC